MARGAGGDIPGDGPGQGFTSSSTCTHVMGVSGAPTGTVGGAVNALSEHAEDAFGNRTCVPRAVFCDGGTQHHPLSATVAKNRMGNAYVCTERRLAVKMKVL